MNDCTIYYCITNPITGEDIPHTKTVQMKDVYMTVQDERFIVKQKNDGKTELICQIEDVDCAIIDDVVYPDVCMLYAAT